MGDAAIGEEVVEEVLGGCEREGEALDMEARGLRWRGSLLVRGIRRRVGGGCER